jgi:hypothetical protein
MNNAEEHDINGLNEINSIDTAAQVGEGRAGL